MNFEFEVIYEMLWNVLALYDKTACYFELPYGESNVEIDQLIAGKIRKVRVAINQFFPEMTVTKRKLIQIVNETERFTLTCEVPGVVKRWRKINPAITYFDASYELCEEEPDLYRAIQLGLNGLRLDSYPDELMMEDRRKYLEKAKQRYEISNMEFSLDALYQEELLRTLKMVFQNDFKEEM